MNCINLDESCSGDLYALGSLKNVLCEAHLPRDVRIAVGLEVVDAPVSEIVVVEAVAEEVASGEAIVEEDRETLEVQIPETEPPPPDEIEGASPK